MRSGFLPGQPRSRARARLRLRRARRTCRTSPSRSASAASSRPRRSARSPTSNGPYADVIRTLNLPASFVILDRVVWGVSALLGKLGAEGPVAGHPGGVPPRRPAGHRAGPRWTPPGWRGRSARLARVGSQVGEPRCTLPDLHGVEGETDDGRSVQAEGAVRPLGSARAAGRRSTSRSRPAGSATTSGSRCSCSRRSAAGWPPCPSST